MSGEGQIIEYQDALIERLKDSLYFALNALVLLGFQDQTGLSEEQTAPLRYAHATLWAISAQKTKELKGHMDEAAKSEEATDKIKQIQVIAKQAFDNVLKGGESDG